MTARRATLVAVAVVSVVVVAAVTAVDAALQADGREIDACSGGETGT